MGATLIATCMHKLHTCMFSLSEGVDHHHIYLSLTFFF